MSGLAGRWNFDGSPNAGDACRRMLAAQKIYGPHDGAQWDDGDIALGRRLFRTLPEDAFDRQPYAGGGGRYRLVAAGPVANLEAAIEFAQKLAASGSLFFKANPLVDKELQGLQEGSLRSRVHEWLNEHCFAMAFSETASELAAAKLSFGASASFFHHVPAFHLTAEGQALIDGTQDVMLRETMRDFLVNRQSRRDYFVKGGRRLAAATRLERLRGFNVVRSRRPQDIDLNSPLTKSGAADSVSIW